FHSGHFQLGLSLAWLPLVFAGLWWTLHISDRRAPVLMAVAFALLFFSGNIYYTLHALVCCLVITVVYFIGQTVFLSFALREKGPGVEGKPGYITTITRLAIGGVLTLGLTAIQFVPVWLARD